MNQEKKKNFVILLKKNKNVRANSKRALKMAHPILSF